jgi:phosphoglycolate phosphatase-like HAD superfamily hydrolase
LAPLLENDLVRDFEAIITREDSYASKPSPEGMVECLRRMDVRPDCGLAVGDSPMDIRAGKRAGALTIGVLSGIANREQLEAEEPTLIIDDVGQIPWVLSGNDG